MSCWIPPFTVSDGKLQKAACGRYVVPATEHSNEPTCPECRLCLEADAATADLTAEDLFGAPTPGTQVRHVDFDPTGGRERTR